MPLEFLAGFRNRSGRRLSRTVRPAVESLEDRRVPTTVHFTVDPQQNVHAISRFIYGVNQSLTGPYANLTFTRLGGNRFTAYNWVNNASNAGSDYLFQNDGYLGGGNTPGGAVLPTLQNAAAQDAGALITVPINGYVAADKNGGGDVRNSGSNYLQTRFHQEAPTKGAPFTLTPDPNAPVVYQDEFVNWVKTNFPNAQTDPNRPIFFSLDNEPDLWSSTHAEVHPAATTYAELVQKSIAYASAIKGVMPGSLVYGPVNYGWQGMVNLQNAPDANGRDFLTFFLQQMKQADTGAGHRLVDVLDVHWYPEATGGGVRITGQDTTPAVVAARLQAPRSLWDSTYTETSWITQWSTMGPIDLLPRLQGKINANDPGMKLSISEYNYGGGADISGGIAEADVLGIFGRDGVFSANEWPLASSEPFIAGAFQMYRNFDGNNGSFGDTSVLAKTDDVPDSSVYASTDSANPNVLTLVALNKTGQPLTSVFQLNLAPNATADVYQLTGASSTPQFVGHLTIPDPSNFTYTLPAYSVSTIRIVMATGTNAPPTVVTPASATPSPVTGTTTQLRVLGGDAGGEANLTYTWATVGTPPAAVSFSANGTNAAKNATATFARAGTYTFRVTISDGSLSTTSDVTVTVNQTLTSVVISPTQVTVKTGHTQQFTATAKDQFGLALTAPPAFSWSVASGGTITQTGLYTAPATAGSATVRVSAGGFAANAAVTVIDAAPPAAPSRLTAAVFSSTRIDLAWKDNSANEAGFLIEMSTDGTHFTQIAAVGANVTKYSATGLLASHAYYFRVRAYNGAGNSAYSNTASARTRRS